MTSDYAPHATKNQDIVELDEFASFAFMNGVRSYLEIGSKYGVSLWRVANVLPVGSRVVSVDMPRNDTSGPKLVECVEALKTLGYDAHLIVGNSHDAEVIDRARHLGPFDLCYIDADHTLEAVTADWTNFGQWAKIVALHDIRAKDTAVPEFWSTIKRGRYIEFGSPRYGIGVVWNA